jgi:dihydroneopterin aldolase
MASSDPASDRTQHAAPDRIIVNRLVVDTFIGVHEFEHAAPQRVRFDIVVETVDDYAEQVRTTGSYVSYADLVDFVTERAASGEHVELVETWAQHVATFALSNELAQAVHVTVQKLDIFDAADGVGISIERRRSPR